MFMAGVFQYGFGVSLSAFLALVLAIILFAWWKGPSGPLSGSLPLSNTENKVLFVALWLVLTFGLNAVALPLIHFLV
jgi:hypothetical protein